VLGEKLLPGRPVALVVVAISIVVVSVTSLGDLGFKTVGQLPQGLPDFHRPVLRARDVHGVVPLAFACFLLAYIESVSAARTLAQKNGYEIDPRPGTAGPWRGESRRRLRPGLPGGRRAVAVVGERRGRRPDAGRADRRLDHQLGLKPLNMAWSTVFSSAVKWMLAAVWIAGLCGAGPADGDKKCALESLTGQ